MLCALCPASDLLVVSEPNVGHKQYTDGHNVIAELSFKPCSPQKDVVGAVESLASTPELVEQCAGAVAARLLPALTSLVATAGDDNDMRYRGLKLLYDILLLFLGDTSASGVCQARKCCCISCPRPALTFASVLSVPLEWYSIST